MPDKNNGKVVTDPSLLEELNSSASSAKGKVVTDSSLLDELNNASTEPKNKSAQVAVNSVDPQVADNNLNFATGVMAKYLQTDQSQPNAVNFQGTNEKGETVHRTYANVPGKGIAISQTTSNAPTGQEQSIKPHYVPSEPVINQPEVQQAQHEINKELTANSDYLKKSAQQLITTAPAIIQDQLKSMGIDAGNFTERLTNQNGDLDALKTFTNVQQTALKNAKDNEILNLENQYPLQAPAGRNEFAQPTRQSQELYDQQRAAIDKKYDDQIAHLNSAAFNVAAVKSFNQEVSRGTDPANVNPYTIGVNMRYALGDKLELGLVDNKDVDPSVKVATELMGYRALDIMKAKAFADGDLPLAKSLEEKTKNATLKVIDDNPEFRKQQVQKAISDKIFANGNSLWESIAGKNVTDEDVQKAGQELGLRPQDYQDIKPEDIKRWSGAINTGINSFIREGAAPLIEAEGRHILNPIASLFGKDYSKRQLNDLYGKDWYDNSTVGRFFEGAAPDNAGIVNQGIKVENNPLSQNYLLNVSDDNDSRWNIGLVPVLNTIANGTGQTTAFALGGEATGAAIRGARLISGAEKATRVGMNAYMWLTGWDRNYRQAAEAVGNNPDDEGKRIGLAAIYNAAEVASENIIPDYQLARKVIGTNAVSSFLDNFKREGAKAITRDGIKNAFRDGVLEAGKNIAGEGLEESATDYGQMVGDMIFAPDKFNKTNYNQQALEDGVVGAVSSFLPVGAGAVREIAEHGPMAKSMVFEVGKNPTYYTEQFRKKMDDGSISHAEGNEKIRLVNTLADIVNKSVPETSFANNEDLTAKQKHDYANLRLQEEMLRHEQATVKDPVQEKYIEERLSKINQQKESILQTAGASSSTTAEPINNNNNGESNQADEAQGGQRRQEGNVLESIPQQEQGVSPEVKQNQTTSSGAISPSSSSSIQDLVSQFEDIEPLNTQQNATQEASQQQQESLQPGGISQRPGIESGQQEAGQGAGSERQAAQPEADNSNRDQRSETQVDINPEHPDLFKKLNSSRSQITIDKTLSKFGEEADRAKHISDNFDDILGRLNEAAQKENVQFQTDCL